MTKIGWKPQGVVVAGLLFFYLGIKAVIPAPAEDHWSVSSQEAVRELVTEANKYLSQEKYDLAVVVLTEAQDLEPDNADLWNLIGFGQRKKGLVEESASAYSKALALNPEHLGALQYQGELFMDRNEVDSAKANLARLEALCPKGCEEHTALAKRIGEAD